jgi:hypothetical protein
MRMRINPSPKKTSSIGKGYWIHFVPVLFNVNSTTLREADIHPKTI